jgi:hypothetical protein
MSDEIKQAAKLYEALGAQYVTQVVPTLGGAEQIRERYKLVRDGLLVGLAFHCAGILGELLALLKGQETSTSAGEPATGQESGTSAGEPRQNAYATNGAETPIKGIEDTAAPADTPCTCLSLPITAQQNGEHCASCNAREALVPRVRL